MHNVSGTAAVPHEHHRSAEPRLQVIEQDWNVLGVASVEDPDLAAGSGPRHAMTIIMEQDALVLGVAAQCVAEPLDIFDTRVQRLLVSRTQQERLVLRLQALGNGLERLLGV